MNEEKPKSVLDDVPVVEVGFPLGTTLPGKKPDQLEIVGSCPRCGAPIHGKKKVNAGEDPLTTFSCDCRDYRPMDSK
jgi:hypothetical protein